MTLVKDGIPWPYERRFREPSSRPDIQEIEWAIARELHEQNLWCDRSQKLTELGLSDNALEAFVQMGLAELCKRMEAEGATYPPTWEQRKKWCEHIGVEWDWSMNPSSKKTEGVNDEKLRRVLMDLIEVGEQKERIKSSVLLPSILKVDPEHEDTKYVFHIWMASKLVDQLQEKLPMPEPALKN